MADKRIPVDLINIRKLKRNKYVFEELPEHLVKRVSRIYPVIEELKFSSFNNLEEWIDGFKRDLYPEREIAIWEVIVGEFLKETKGKEMSLEKKREIFRKILNKNFFGQPV